MTKRAEITSIMSNRLQRFIPDRENAEGMAEALQEDLYDHNYRIVPVHGERATAGGQMSDLVAEMRKVARLNGDTYSTAEVIGMLSRGAQEIEQLRAALKPFVEVALGDRLNPTPDEWRAARDALE